MAGLGHDASESELIADHLIDCELRGLAYGGLARAISIAERFERTAPRAYKHRFVAGQVNHRRRLARARADPELMPSIPAIS